MTQEEAIECLSNPYLKPPYMLSESIKMAIEAIEKQITKPVTVTPYFYGETYSCPICKQDLDTKLGKFPRFCSACGQALDYGVRNHRILTEIEVPE